MIRLLYRRAAARYFEQLASVVLRDGMLALESQMNGDKKCGVTFLMELAIPKLMFMKQMRGWCQATILAQLGG